MKKLTKTAILLTGLLLFVSSAYGDPGIGIEKSTNGFDADVAPGPAITVGDPVTWTYTVTNISTGDEILTEITVIDDQGVVPICPETTLAKNESMTCTAGGIALLDQYTNTATVEGYGDGALVFDTDSSHYIGEDPSADNPIIDIEKLTNGEDADDSPGPIVSEGTTVTWEYVVTNIGDMTLNEITVNDDIEGLISCPQSALIPGDSMTCTASGIAGVDQYKNIGTATGIPRIGPEVSDTDSSHYYGRNTAPMNIKIGRKSIKSAPINLRSHGKVPVAVMSGDGFNAATIIPSSVLFAGAWASHWNFVNVGGSNEKLILHFPIQDLLDLNQDSTTATLTGQTSEGVYFEGTDDVRIVPAKPAKPPKNPKKTPKTPKPKKPKKPNPNKPNK